VATIEELCVEAMSRITRRQFMSRAAALGATLAYGCARPRLQPWREQRNHFPQGVASGDPDAESVILWTRRPPVAGSTAHRLAVEVARDRDFTDVVATAEAAIAAESDWTCRILAAGLEPAREYWYRFTDEHGSGSRVGRTVTAPADSDDRPVRFAFVSCQSVTEGAFNAYRRMIHEDERRPRAEQLSFVLHLGDYIYEVIWYPEDKPEGRYARKLREVYRMPNGEKIGDLHVPTTLEDYRTTYRAYLEDPDLQDARARWPFVCVWDNHEFSWQGFQSQQVFNGKVRPAQKLRVIANQAWFEFQPARVSMPGTTSLDRFVAPRVENKPLGERDELGLGLDPDNLAAVRSLKIYRALRFGRHIDLLITDLHSFRSEQPSGVEPFIPSEFRWAVPQEAVEMLDSGRAYRGGHPPATLRYGGRELANPTVNAPPQSSLGREQKAWFLDRLRQSKATWKIWGLSQGTLDWRSDYQNLPEGVGPRWPGQGYAMFNGSYFVERGEILDVVRDAKIAGFAVVAGDKHSFWAGRVSKSLPPDPFEPMGVEFVTGSISAPGLFESAEYGVPREDPLRALYLHDRPDGTVAPAINMTILHGVRASLTLHKTDDVQQALAQSNPDVAPHLSFADLGGHGYATVRVSADQMETEFVCIPRPIERSERPDGGPLAYRVIHRVKMWRPGEPPRLVAEVVEGEPPLAMKS